MKFTYLMSRDIHPIVVIFSVNKFFKTIYIYIYIKLREHRVDYNHINWILFLKLKISCHLKCLAYGTFNIKFKLLLVGRV
jgi:hypothetical protein